MFGNRISMESHNLFCIHILRDFQSQHLGYVGYVWQSYVQVFLFENTLVFCFLMFDNATSLYIWKFKILKNQVFQKLTPPLIFKTFNTKVFIWVLRKQPFAKLHLLRSLHFMNGEWWIICYTKCVYINSPFWNGKNVDETGLKALHVRGADKNTTGITWLWPFLVVGNIKGEETNNNTATATATLFKKIVKQSIGNI